MKTTLPPCGTQPRKLIHIGNHHRQRTSRAAALVADRVLERIPFVAEINHLYDRLISGADGGAPFSHILHLLGTTYLIGADDLARIPDHGPLVVVANHPFGGIEGIILGDLLQRIRPDVKILGNHLLARIEPLRESLIPIDPFGRKSSVTANSRAYRSCIRWLHTGGCLVVFPAGEVSHFRPGKRCITDPPWIDHVAALVRMSGADVLPVYFPGHNSLLFNLVGMIHPRLRTLLLPRELLARENTRIRLFVGRHIAHERLSGFDDNRALIDWLRFRTYFQANRETGRNVSIPSSSREAQADNLPAPLIPPVPADLLAAEVAALDAADTLIRHKAMRVFVADSPAIPHLLREIGRLREKSFREAGEGTGKAMDVDLFDSYYRHLILWNDATREIVGAYRMGDTREILDRFGRRGLYTHSLFRFKSGIFRYLSHSLELGRSFIRSEYQRQPNCLALLWKGIGAYLVRYPQYRLLFGPVSISNSYHRFSKEIMIQFLKRNCGSQELEAYVSPRCPFRVKSAKAYGGDASLPATSIDDVSMLVAEIEGDGKRVPVLIKHYLKLSGQFIAFNVDHAFCDAVDGLVVVDLMETEPRLLQRFMGTEGFRSYREANGGNVRLSRSV